MSIWRTEQTFSKQKRIEDSLFPFINYPAFTDFQLTFAKGYSKYKKYQTFDTSKREALLDLISSDGH